MFVEVDGFHIAFSDIGHGEPVVLLPGKFMTRQRWFEVGIAESLAEEFRVLAIDPLGFGESSKPHSPDDYSSAVVAGGIAAVLDDREVDAAHLWGKLTYDVDILLKKELGDKQMEFAEIGPAGEKLANFAAVMNMSNRAWGRTGGGAVVGGRM